MTLNEVVVTFKADISKLKRDLDTVKKNVHSTKDTFNSLGTTAKNVSKSLIALVVVANVVDQFKKASQAANEYESALTSLTRLSEKFGYDSNAAQKAVQELTKDGLITTTTAANGLAKLFQGGMNLPQAMQLMQGYKDQAAFGRSSTLSFDQAVTNLTESFYTENSAIGNLAGQTENWQMIEKKGAAIMGKSTSQLNEKERAMAKYLGQLELNKLVQGDASKYAETSAGKMAKLQSTLTSLYIVVGQVLQPAVMLFASALGDYLSAAVTWVTKNLGSLRIAAAYAAAYIVSLLQVLNAAGRAFWTFVGGNVNGALGILKNIGSDVKNTFNNAMKATTDTTKKETGKQVETVKQGLGEQTAAQQKKTADVQKELEKETESFKEEQEKRKKQYEDSLAEMVQAHLEKRQQLETDLKEENTSFEESMKEREQGYQERVQEMADSHQEKVDDIKNQMAQLESLGADYDKQKVRDLQKQINIEKKNGEEANYELIQQLQDQIDEEIQLGKDTQKEKLKDLEEQLQAEEKEYDKQAQKEKKRYEEQVAKDKKQHDEKLASLQKRIDEEQAILSKHSAEVAQFKDKEVEDDITRLQRKYAEENVEIEKQHQKRLAEIQSKGSESGGGDMGGVGGGMDMADLGGSGKNPFVDSMVPAKGDGKDSFQGMVEYVNTVFIPFFKNTLHPFIVSVESWFQQHWGPIQDTVSMIFEGVCIMIMSCINDIQRNWSAWGDMMSGVLLTLKGNLMIIWAAIYAFLAIALGILTGDWNLAWVRLKVAASLAFEGVRDIFQGFINFLKGTAGILVDALTKPFKDAYREIEKTALDIKRALQPISVDHRNSPSLVDRVQTGVQDIKDAYSDLQSSMIDMTFGRDTMALGLVPPQIQTNNAATSYTTNQTITQKNIINSQVDMDGAMRELGWRLSTD